ncbi:hypothetical protein HMPREF1981_01980 [Bacteroides pyogenes F0041]|uniref:Uncharacterized protein n=1 Tax=Bacteroides pyogenes F0041 TaxID=1321819 RepID=U2C3Q3_9BACE|nr:hypothetical protein HMPREF1981_01980 [Bacteroides pyogenes F0041]GAE21295.1 hypothetical protein JCM10003_723 [Bacteroides pyogenes JCM 10003]
MLQDITNIERKYTKRRTARYIIVHYASGQMFHNFFEIDGKMFDVEQMLQVIQKHYPEITIR